MRISDWSSDVCSSDLVAEFYWIVMPDSPIKTVEDLKGKRLGFTNPKSTSQALDFLLLKQLGLTQDDVSMVKTGGFGPMLVALQEGGQIGRASGRERGWQYG